MIIGLVQDSANHGTLFSNPFLVEHCNLNYIQVTVNGQDLNEGPIQPVYGPTPETGLYMEAYKTLCCLENTNSSVPVSREDYPQGFCFYRFTADPQNGATDDDVIPLRRSGNMRISVKFEKALKEPTTMIVFAKFAAALKIDKNRAVYEV